MEKEANLKYYWIVYLTTNLVNKYIYIGVHKTLTPNKFDGYIGCGVNINNYKTYKHPKTKFQYAVKEFGPKNFIRKVLHVFEDDKSAYLLEGRLVNDQFLARSDVYNMIRGGIIANDGNPTQCYCYDLDGKFVSEFISMQSAGDSINCTATAIKYAIINKTPLNKYYWTNNYYELLDIKKYKKDVNTKEIKLNNTNPNGKPIKIKIYQYSNLGKYEKEYDSIQEAAIENNSTTTNIVRGINLGYLVNNKYFSKEKYDKFSLARFKSIRKNKVYQYALDGTFIKEWENANQAKVSLNIKSDIGAAIKRGRTCGNYQWSIEKIDKMPDLTKINRSGIARKVAVYDLNGNLVEIFNTVTECQKKYSSCKHVLHGKREIGNGHKFKYID